MGCLAARRRLGGPGARWIDPQPRAAAQQGSGGHCHLKEETMRKARRMLLLGVAVLIVGAVALGSAEPAKKFVFGQSGGASMEASRDILRKPFTARTGIQVEPLLPSTFGKLRPVVEARQVVASLWDLGSSDLEQAIALNLVEKVDWAKVNPGPMFPEMKRDYGFGQTYFSTGSSWKKGTPPISTWADFWNVQK